MDKKAVAVISIFIIIGMTTLLGVSSVKAEQLGKIKKGLICYGTFPSADYAARFDLLSINFGVTNLQAVRALNPDIIICGYKDLIAMGNWMDDWSIVNQHEDWFIHDSSGNRIRQKGPTPWYCMNPASQGWRDHFVTYVRGKMGQYSGYDGVMGDDAWSYLFKDNFENAALIPDYPNWHQAMTDFLRYIKANISPKMLYYSGPSKDYIAVADGQVLENFVFVLGAYRTEKDWIDCLATQSATGKGVLIAFHPAVEQNNPSAEKNFNFAFACLLLGINGPNAIFSWARSSTYPSHGYYPLMDVDAGNPAGGYYVKDGLYMRNFDKARVLANLDTVYHQTTINGQTYVLGPKTGQVILINQQPAQNESWIYFDFAPEPATSSSTVTLKGILVNKISNPIASAPVRVEYSTNGGASWNYMVTLTTNQYGVFSRAFMAPAIGKYLVRVSYAGNATYGSTSSSAYLIVLSTTPGGTATGNMLFNFIPSPAKPGSSVTLRGILMNNLNQPIASTAVRIEYSTNNGATWSYIWTLTTNQYGVFSRAFTAPAIGAYLVRATYGSSNIITYLLIQ